ncbi:MAG: STAS domain-containing protein [Wenzhouxiangellaceae bacterium]|nr:STAS domain-containing protein [Wenzhouxiangellaceae bacterium]
MIDLSPDADGRVALTGELTVDEVPAIYKASLGWKKYGLPRAIDLSRLELTDSSAVALLLEWAAWARRRDRRIDFVDPPEGLRTIAGLSSVGPLLGWEEDQ